MATSFNVNINIGSGIGYNIVGGSSGLIGNIPQLQTVKTLDGVYYTTSTTYTATYGPILDVNVNELADFVSPIGILSSKQTVRMTNNGNAELIITDIVYTYNNNIGPRFFFSNGATILGKATIKLLPGQSETFQLAYLGAAQNQYNNYFVIISNNTGGYYKVNTHQVIKDTKDLIVYPLAFNTTTTHVGQTSLVTYKFAPVFNDTSSTVIVPYTHSIEGHRAWTIYNTGTNYVSMKFNSWKANNANGTYISTLTIVANSVTKSIVNTATIAINTLLNKNLKTWISPLSKHNSVVGISYDLEDGNRVLTIGVGMGGDNSYIVENGFDYNRISYLGLGAGTLLDPYPYWADVCKITFTGNEQTYYSGDYKVKTTAAHDYMKYFGDYGKLGSMFIVKDDGYGSITIELNHLRALSGNADFDVTLQNLTRAFHYYSTTDVLGRIGIQKIEYGSSIDGYNTYLFTGFNYNTRDKLAFVNTSIVALPV